jgi:hypothetical protein
MLKHWQILAILLLAATPFTIYATARPDLDGFDSYAFLNQSCRGKTVEHQPPLATALLQAIPCNILIIKAVLATLFAATLLGVASLGTLFHEKHGWLAAAFSFLSPSLLFEAVKLENDQFAIPLLIWACYFFYKARKTKNPRFDIASLALIMAAAGFWYGAIYFLLALALTSLVLIVPGLAALTIYWQQLIGNTLPKAGVVESMMGTGLTMIAGLVFAFNSIPKQMLAQAAVFLFLAAMQIKFAWMIVPILSVAMMRLYTTKQHRLVEQAKPVFLTMSFLLVVAWGFALTGHPPHLHQWQAVDYAIEQSGDGFVWSDWDYGYWVEYRGGTTFQAGGGEQKPHGKGIVLTRGFLQDTSGCTLLETFGDTEVWRC